MDVKLLITVFATGRLLGSHVNPRLLGRIAGVTFIAVGIWTLLRA